jgi:two-component system alkaline phosphatase synthesis response regulator PhoP
VSPDPAAATPARILVVEDDRDIAELVARYLERAGYLVDVVGSGREALKSLETRTPALLVLDLMLPHVDGLEICRVVRSQPATANVPVIMVTARADVGERITGLETGADDYLAKPFSPGELVARVRALLRRSDRRETAQDTTATYGGITINVDQHTVECQGCAVTLTAKEFLLLQYFVRHKGRVLSRDVLLTDVWGYKYTGGTRTVDVHVRRLREKLPPLEQALVTVKQFGYKLLDPPPS